MARVTVIECDNCGAEVDASPEANAAMTQIVITRGGSRSHVYELCPECASGFTRALPADIVEWPRYVTRESVQEWLRHTPVGKLLGIDGDHPLLRASRPGELSPDEKERREAAGDFGHVRRPTEYGDGFETEKES